MRKPVFHPDDARPHTASISAAMLSGFKCDSIEKRAYCPNLALADFQIFSFLKKDFRGLQFHSNMEVIEWVTQWLCQEFWKAIFDMPQHWEECAKRDDDYEEN